MKRLLAVFALVFLAGGLQAETLRIADATRQGDPAVRQAALLYAARTPGTKLSFRRVEVKEALELFREGETDLVLIDRKQVPADFKGKERAYAAEAAAVYLSGGHFLNNFTTKEVKELLTLQLPNWSRYGKKETDVHRFGLKPKSRGYGLFEEFLRIPPESVGRLFRASSTREMLLFIGKNDEAVGFGLFLPSAPLDVKIAAIDGVPATLRNISEGKYPLTVTYVILSAETPAPVATGFLATLNQADFLDLLEEIDLLPLLVKN